MGDLGFELASSIRAKPLTKPSDLWLRVGRGESDLLFPHRDLHLGSLAHFLIEHQLTGSREVPMPKFIDFMNRTLSEGKRPYGDRVLEKLEGAANAVKEKLGQTVEDGWRVSWLSELPFEPSPKQVRTIEKAFTDPAFHAYIRNLGYASLDQFSVDVLTNPRFRLEKMDLVDILDGAGPISQKNRNQNLVKQNVLSGQSQVIIFSGLTRLQRLIRRLLLPLFPKSITGWLQQHQQETTYLG
jgi:hypothetical protein